MADGFTILSAAYDFIAANDALKFILWVAVVGVALSVFFGIFFKGR